MEDKKLIDPCVSCEVDRKCLNILPSTHCAGKAVYEYAVKDKQIASLKAENVTLDKSVSAQREEILRLKAEVERLRCALKPFVDEYNNTKMNLTKFFTLKATDTYPARKCKDLSVALREAKKVSEG